MQSDCRQRDREKYADEHALLLLERFQISLQNNAKIVVPANTELVNVIGELAGGILPLKKE